MTKAILYKPQNDSVRRDYRFCANSPKTFAAKVDSQCWYTLSVENPSLFLLQGEYKAQTAITVAANDDHEVMLNEAYETNEFCINEKRESLRADGRFWGINVGDVINLVEQQELWVVEAFGFRLLGEK